MAVAVQKEMDQPQLRPTSPTLGLAQASLWGSVYLALGLLGIYHLLPYLWRDLLQIQGGLISRMGLLVLVAGATAGWIYAWKYVVPKVEGVKAGVAFGFGGGLVLGFILDYLLCMFVDGILYVVTRGKPDAMGITRPIIGIIVAGGFAYFWLRLIWRYLHASSFQKQLVHIENQGWFQLDVYKKGQGKLIRRLTLLSALVLLFAGVIHFWPMIQRNFTGVWLWPLPFVSNLYIPIANAPGITVTTVLVLLGLFVSNRLVNAVPMADFLIATSGEMNKVTWSTRLQIRKDTMVVLVVTFLLSAYLLLMDVFWLVVLRFLGVIKH